MSTDLRTENRELRLTPCGPHLRMKRPQRDGQSGFLRSLASPLEADSTRCRRGRPCFYLTGNLFYLQRPAQRASARSFLAYRKTSLPPSDTKLKGQSARETPPRHSGPRQTPPPLPQGSFPTHSELPAGG